MSINERLYDAGFDRAATLKRSFSEYVSRLIYDDLRSAGIEPPTTVHASERALPEAKLVQRVANEEILPAVAIAKQKMPDVDPKLLHALEHTRRQLELKKSEQRHPIEVVKADECYWCGETFKAGQIPLALGEHKIHHKCSREMERTGAV